MELLQSVGDGSIGFLWGGKEEMISGYWGWPYRFARYREIRDLWFLPEKER